MALANISRLLALKSMHSFLFIQRMFFFGVPGAVVHPLGPNLVVKQDGEVLCPHQTYSLERMFEGNSKFGLFQAEPMLNI